MIKKLVKQYRLTNDNKYLEELLEHLDGTLTKYATSLVKLNDSTKTLEDYYNDLVLSLLEIIQYTDPDIYSTSQYSHYLYARLAATSKKLASHYEREIDTIMLHDTPSCLLIAEDDFINHVTLDDLLKHSLTAKQYNVITNVILEGIPKTKYAEDNKISVQAASQICRYALHKLIDNKQLHALLTM